MDKRIVVNKNSGKNIMVVIHNGKIEYWTSDGSRELDPTEVQVDLD